MKKKPCLICYKCWDFEKNFTILSPNLCIMKANLDVSKAGVTPHRVACGIWLYQSALPIPGGSRTRYNC